MKYNSLIVYWAALLLSGLCRLSDREEFDRRQCSSSVFPFEQLCPFVTDGLKQHRGEVSLGQCIVRLIKFCLHVA